MKAFRKAALAVAIATGASTAGAMPLSQLFFSQNAGWQSPAIEYNGGGSLTYNNALGGDAPANTFSNLSWTGPAGTSFVDLMNFTSDTSAVRLTSGLAVDGDGEWNAGDIWAIDTLVQTNNILTGGPFPNPLWISNTSANFRVYDDAVGGNTVLEDLDSETEVTFWETPNVDGCAGSPSPLYDQGVADATAPQAPACDDRYRVRINDFAPISFVQDGFIYEIGFTILPGFARDNNGVIVGTTLICGLPGLVDPRCTPEYIPLNPAFAAVYTPEFAPGTSEVFVAAFWTVRGVPVPGVIGLIGIGLAALGFAARRRG